MRAVRSSIILPAYRDDSHIRMLPARQPTQSGTAHRSGRARQYPPPASPATACQILGAAGPPACTAPAARHSSQRVVPLQAPCFRLWLLAQNFRQKVCRTFHGVSAPCRGMVPLHHKSSAFRWRTGHGRGTMYNGDLRRPRSGCRWRLEQGRACAPASRSGAAAMLCS